MAGVLGVVFWTAFIVLGAFYTQSEREKERDVRRAWYMLEPFPCQLQTAAMSHSPRFGNSHAHKIEKYLDVALQAASFFSVDPSVVQELIIANFAQDFEATFEVKAVNGENVSEPMQALWSFESLYSDENNTKQLTCWRAPNMPTPNCFLSRTVPTPLWLSIFQVVLVGIVIAGFMFVWFNSSWTFVIPEWIVFGCLAYVACEYLLFAAKRISDIPATEPSYERYVDTLSDVVAKSLELIQAQLKRGKVPNARDL